MATYLPLKLEELQTAAFELGFPLVGATESAEAPGFAKFCHWLDLGYAGSMEYLSSRREAYRHPSSILESARTLIMLGMPYAPAPSLRKRRAYPAPILSRTTALNSYEVETAENQFNFHEAQAGTGRVAAYASGTRDYHDLIHERLKALSSWMIRRCPDAEVRGVVDTAPLLEREFAALAGLGWIGKNTLLLNQQAGSFFFLAALLTNIEVDRRLNIATDHCGTCTACLDACPTHAFPQPRVLDATRCISYLTIEHRGPIPIELRESIGNWVFGCDICQQVCPWNRMAKESCEPSFQPQPDLEALDLMLILSLDDDGFRRKYRKTPIWRTRRVGMQRNAIIVLGNQRKQEALPLIVQHLSSNETTLRQTAAWAIGRIRNPHSHSDLMAQLDREDCPEVRAEILEALNSLQEI